MVRKMLGSLGQIEGFRHSEAGEFTQRAFYSNKLDLTQVEGLSSLLQAQTEMQRSQSLHMLNGKLEETYRSWELDLTRVMAKIEAFLDFSEDDNVSEAVLKEGKSKTKGIRIQN